VASFKHSGDLGDIIYSLPALRALGGGTLYLDPTGGRTDPFVQKHCPGSAKKFNLNSYHSIRPLLLQQPYIQDVKIWQNESVNFNFNAMLPLITNCGIITLAALYLRTFKLDESQAEPPWLTLQSPPISLPKDILINRTLRYQSKYIIWELKKALWIKRAIFIGTQDEHRFFQHTFDCQIDYHKTDDAVQIAQLLKGCHKLIANQSFVMAIAIGLGIEYLQEVYMQVPNCIYKRENAEYF